MYKNKSSLSNNAIAVLSKRYIKTDRNTNIKEDIDGLFARVSNAIGDAEFIFNNEANTDEVNDLKETFYNMMINLEMLPNSPTLMNAGRELGQLSACFVLPIEDTMEGIFDSIKDAALVHKTGGGTGMSFSRLRSNGSIIKTTGGISSGPISFMNVFNAATDAVKQGGARRGANMGMLRVDHPDIEEFIQCKSDTSVLTNFNISVALTDNFMIAVKDDSLFELKDPNTKAITKIIKARKIFNMIVENAWKTGEPGIIFLDNINKFNTTPNLGDIEATNPCGEQPLLPYEACNLASINLVKMLQKKENGEYEIDLDKLKKTVELSVRFLDNVIEVNNYPLKKIDEKTKLSRRIGLGVMGFADALLLLKIPYNSINAKNIATFIMKNINYIGHKYSEELGKERGAFPCIDDSLLCGTYRRNATVTTIAPTGTLSIIANCSSGVEPIFAFAYIRNIMDNTEFVEFNPILKEELITRGIYTEELAKKIAKEGTLQHIDEIPQDIKDIFLCAHDIDYRSHINIQAAFQEHTDNAVSKTINFSNDASNEDIKNAYMMAYNLGCKGTTVYRDGCRSSQVLNIGSVNEKNNNTSVIHEKISPPRKRDSFLNGVTEKVKIGWGNRAVTVNYDEPGICEVFTSTGKSGGCPSQSEATARLTSIALRSGIDVDEIISQLKGIRCPSTIRQNGLRCTSCPDAIAKNIIKVKEKIFDKNVITPLIINSDEKCPGCGNKLNHEGGCNICSNCGYSKCK